MAPNSQLPGHPIPQDQGQAKQNLYIHVRKAIELPEKKKQKLSTAIEVRMLLDKPFNNLQIFF